MITINDISYTISDRQLLDHVSFTLSRGVIGLVGDNGAGKTTLLCILADQLSPDEGVVKLPHEVIGYLPQSITFDEKSVAELIADRQQPEIDHLLDEVGLKGIDLRKAANQLSGGEKTKLALAPILSAIPSPTVLLLDEPTNNLDTDGIRWIRSMITQFPGPVLLTSHDRQLLDDTADTIIELSSGHVKLYGGNYSHYRQHPADCHRQKNKKIIAQAHQCTENKRA